MAEAGSLFLAEVMLWLMYIVFGVAVVAVIVSAVRSYWLNNRK
jgi:hypothetical protein